MLSFHFAEIEFCLEATLYGRYGRITFHPTNVGSLIHSEEVCPINTPGGKFMKDLSGHTL